MIQTPIDYVLHTWDTSADYSPIRELRKGERNQENEWLMAQADIYGAAKTFLTLGATSTTECELNVQKPITELDGVATQKRYYIC